LLTRQPLSRKPLPMRLQLLHSKSIRKSRPSAAANCIVRVVEFEVGFDFENKVTIVNVVVAHGTASNTTRDRTHGTVQRNTTKGRAQTKSTYIWYGTVH